LEIGLWPFGEGRLRKPRSAIRVATPRRRAPQIVGATLALLLWVWLSAFNVPARADPMALWRIVHDACVPHFQAGLGPKPCERVDLDGGVDQGAAILKDLVGVAQMLAIPTRRMTGIEDPQMLAPNAPPVFADAWGAKTLVEARLGRALPRDAVGLAINSKWARSQDQFHIHVDCMAVSVMKVLADYAPALDSQWRAMTVPLQGRVYLARRLDSADLVDVAPLKLLAHGIQGARDNMGAYSLAAVGATFAGKPGFVLLADLFSLEGGGHAEDLEDHDCAIAGSTP
jgi:CDP-diacylglycerol pyrophosphatase